MWGGGESWGLEKKKARTHPVTFPEVVPGPKSTLPHPPGWPKALLLLHPKGTEAGQLATSEVRGFRQGRLPLHCPSLLGGVSTPRRHRLAQSCSTPAASTLGAHQL